MDIRKQQGRRLGIAIAAGRPGQIREATDDEGTGVCAAGLYWLSVAESVVSMFTTKWG
ncbi:MAG: hypothetical protein ABSH33_21205 [Steroidobacteraceae bacterium]